MAVVGDSILVFIFNQLRLRVWWNVNSNMCVVCAKGRRGRENQVNLTLLLIIKDRRKSNEMLSSTTFTFDIISLFLALSLDFKVKRNEQREFSWLSCRPLTGSQEKIKEKVQSSWRDGQSLKMILFHSKALQQHE